MSKQASRRLFRTLLLFLVIVVYLISVAPVSQPQAVSSCNPPPLYCIEYTVWNEENCRCECPNQECCDFYYPFVPFGCDGNPAKASSLKSIEGSKWQFVRPGNRKGRGFSHKMSNKRMQQRLRGEFLMVLWVLHVAPLMRIVRRASHSKTVKQVYRSQNQKLSLRGIIKGQSNNSFNRSAG